MLEALENLLSYFPSRGEQLVTVVGGAGAYCATLLFGTISPQLVSLLILLVADYVCGMAAAIKNGELSLTKASRGFAKKTITCGVVGLGHQVDIATGTDLVQSLLISGYCINEALSIIENLCRAGYSAVVPDSIYKALEILKDRNQGRIR